MTDHQFSMGKQQRSSGFLGYAKLLLLGVWLWSLWRGVRGGPNPPFLIGSVVILCAFLVLWIIHSRVLEQIQYHQGHIRILQRYLARMDGTWTQFADSGAEYVDYNHPYSYDLDLFGPNSLFQFLQVTNTYHGRRQLCEDLQNPPYTAKEIQKRQEAIRELAGNDDFSHELQYYGSLLQNRDSIEKLLEHLNKPNTFLTNEWASLLLRYMPIVFAPAALVIFALQIQQLYITATGLLGIMTVVWLCFSLRTHNDLGFVTKAKYGLGRYKKLFQLIGDTVFQSELLRKLQNDTTSGKHSAAAAIKQLERIVNRVDMRRNGIVYFLLNVLFLWDVRCALDIQAWKEKYRGQFDVWFESLGTLEALVSYSVLENTLQGISYPVPVSDRDVFEAQSLGHPLIPDQKRVCNDFILQQGITMISGSNMSGKTTFLRTVGINLVLAKCGACVCAVKLKFSDFHLVSSMRILDDLSEGVSTFYAELRKISAILELAHSEPNVLFLIDEIFRGTNSADRTAGAKAVMQTLYECGACGFLTTHDLQLCQAGMGIHINNWHFAEQYSQDTITFDYNIRRGIATSTNGKYLMRMLNILKEC